MCKALLCRTMRWLVAAGMVLSLVTPATAGGRTMVMERTGWSVADSFALLAERFWEVVEKVGQSMDPDGEPKRSVTSRETGAKVGQSMDPDG